MGRRHMLSALAGAALLAGCAHLGLDPFPDVRHKRQPAAKPAVSDGSPAPAAATAVARQPEPPPPPPPPPPPTFALKFAKGAKGGRIVTADVDVNLAAMQMTMTTKSELEFSHEVLDVRADGTSLLSLSLVGIKGSSSSPFTGDVKYDTRDPESVKKASANPMVGQALQPLLALVGKPMTFTLSPLGEAVMENTSGTLADGVASAVGGGDLGTMFTGVGGHLPMDPVSLGLSWTYKSEGKGPMGAVTMRGTAKVSAWDEASKVASIGYEGTISITAPEHPDPNDMQAQAMAMMKVKSSEVKGESVFDQGRGMMVSNRSKSKLVMDSPMAGGEVIVEVRSETRLVP